MVGVGSSVLVFLCCGRQVSAVGRGGRVLFGRLCVGVSLNGGFAVVLCEVR